MFLDKNRCMSSLFDLRGLTKLNKHRTGFQKLKHKNPAVKSVLTSSLGKKATTKSAAQNKPEVDWKFLLRRYSFSFSFYVKDDADSVHELLGPVEDDDGDLTFKCPLEHRSGDTKQPDCDLEHMEDHECDECEEEHLDDHECVECELAHLDDHECGIQPDIEFDKIVFARLKLSSVSKYDVYIKDGGMYCRHSEDGLSFMCKTNSPDGFYDYKR